MFFKKLIPSFKNVDEKIKNIIKIGLYVSTSLAILSSIIMFTYLTYFQTLTVYYLGLATLKLGILTATAFIIAGLSTDRIKRELHW